MSRRTYHATVRARDRHGLQKTVTLTDVTPNNANDSRPVYRQTRVAAAGWCSQARIGDRISFSAEVSDSSGRLIRIEGVYDSEGCRLDPPRPGASEGARRRRRQELLRQYHNGKSMADLGRQRRLSRQRISVQLRTATQETYGSVPPRLHRVNYEETLRQQFASFYLAGTPRKEIAKLLGISLGPIPAMIDAAGLPRRICAICHQAVPSARKYCDQCRKTVAAANRQAAARNRARLDQRTAAGLCHDCERPAESGKVRCKHCLLKATKVSRDKRRKAPLNRTSPPQIPPSAT